MKKNAGESDFVDPARISCYCKKVPQERLSPCVLSAETSKTTGWLDFWLGLSAGLA
jgi:hypothetical protein